LEEHHTTTTTTQRNAPVNVNGLTSGVIGFRPGGNHTCARLTGGALKCWGLNDQGQLGDGTTTQRTTPVTVSGVSSGSPSLAMGYAHTCARITGGGLKCWGSNSNGQLSHEAIPYSTTPLVINFASYTYTYGNSAHKHAMTDLSSSEHYTYDENGNPLAPGASAGVITRVEDGVTYTQNYDADREASPKRKTA
jgi:alpha-tubulin suppressor-like RCC1 family protein